MTKPGFYLPFRDSRHRHASLALYRRLLTLTKSVSLPDDLPPHPSGPRNPLAHQIRKAFVRNQWITSPRLVAAALNHGYRGLAALTDARDPAHPSYAEVIDFLRSRRHEANRSRSAQTHTPEERRVMKDTQGPKRPILKRVPGPLPLPPSADGIDDRMTKKLLSLDYGRLTNADYHYERATPAVPKEQLGGSGRRQVPHLEYAYMVTPFLRYKKPQPRVLTHVVGERGVRYIDTIVELQDWQDSLVPAALDEDEWDAMVGDGPPKGLPPRADNLGILGWTETDDSTGEKIEVTAHYGSIQVGCQHLYNRMETMKTDFILRGDALNRIVVEERALAEKEKKERQEEKWKKRMEKKKKLDARATHVSLGELQSEPQTPSPTAPAEF